MRLIAKLLILTLVFGSLTACVSKKKFDELQASKEAVDRALAETQTRVKALEGQNAELQSTLESEKTRLNGEIAAIRKDLDATKGQMSQLQSKLSMTEAELAKLRAEIDGIFNTYKNSGLTLENRSGRLYVMTAPVNFGNGSSSLSRDQRKALDELAMTLKNNPNVKVLVEGHTDNKQFAAGSGMDNWQLSVNRSMSVVRYLIRKGVKPAQVAAVGRGENLPEGDNATKEGRAKNRRSAIAPDVELGGLKQN
ncbi:MAG: OmpA family protein [Saprospiraceae bacterium]|nr:OmpA family protein [Saprospiraceae bacterium]